MAITWKWNEKCGKATFRQTIDGMTHVYTVDLYVGNCFLIMVNSNGDEDLLHSFFVDEGHMERCLEKGIFTGIDVLETITINKAKCRNYKKIVYLLAEYMDDVDISVYKDGEYTWKEWKTPAELIPYERMSGIATNALWTLHINGEGWGDELYDAGLDLSCKEKEYFGIPTGE